MEGCYLDKSVNWGVGGEKRFDDVVSLPFLSMRIHAKSS